MENIIAEHAPRLSHARALFLRGYYHAAIAQLSALPKDAAQTLELARAFLRLAKYRDAIAHIRAARDSGAFAEPRTALPAAAMECFASACCGDAVDVAHAIALTALAQGVGGGISNDVDFHVASTLYMLGDHTQTQHIVSRHRAMEQTAGDKLFAGRFLILEGLLHCLRGHHHEHARCFARALKTFLLAEERDVGLCAVAAQGLAGLTRDIETSGAVELIVEAEQALQWPPELLPQRFQILRLLGWEKAMRGDYIAAIRQIAASSRIASTPLCRFASHLDQAWVATISKQNVVARAALCDAAEYLNDDDTSALLCEDAAAFTLAAELFADSDVALAQRALERAQHSAKNVPRNASYAHDDRLGAMIDFAEAAVREARGERRIARARAERAYDVFAPIGYTWRAGKCAAQLYRLTGKTHWLNAVRDAVSAYPRSFLAADFARWEQAGRTPQERLTRRQREIFELLRKGLTFVQIGEALGCSPNTVRVHTGRIYEVFGVPKNAGLKGLFRALSSSAA